ncbi:MAG TPA: cell division protein FtsH, partial [Firmicutes bacterium]|jgi:cell division protease FtsH|nr:cell division protein FtsH [Bacillota bacterium]
LGYTLQLEETEKVLLTKEQALEKVIILLGGRAAEELALKTVTTGAANDIEQATKIARSLVTRFGMSEEFDMMALETVNNPYLGGDTSLLVSAETASRIDDVVLGIIKDTHEQALQILKENKDMLHRLAKHLFEKETITGEEFMSLLAE